MSELIAQTNGDVKEAIERTREAEAYRREAYIKRFNGDKDAADRAIAARRARGMTSGR